MIKTIDHRILSSLKEFLRYRISTELSAFQNKTVTLYENNSVRIANKAVYSSPYAQWCYDTSVTGANVPTQVSDGKDRDDGAIFDFNNGRVLLPSANTGLSLTANVAVNEFNYYISTKSDQKFISETKFDTLYDLSVANAPIMPDSLIAPCVVFKFRSTKTEDFTLGGGRMDEWMARAIVVCFNEMEALGVQRVIRNYIGRYFPILDDDDTPLNEYGDLKNPSWNYAPFLNENDPSKLAFIESGEITALEIDSFSRKNPGIIVYLASLKIKVPNF